MWSYPCIPREDTSCIMLFPEVHVQNSDGGGGLGGKVFKCPCIVCIHVPLVNLIVKLLITISRMSIVDFNPILMIICFL